MSVSQLDLFHDGPAREEFRVRHSKRARRLSIHVSEHRGVEVVVPPRTRPRDVQRFVESHRDWIAKARRHFDLDGQPAVLPDSVTLAFSAATYRVEYRCRTARRGWREEGETLCLAAARADFDAGRTALRDWLGAQGRRQLVPALAARAAQMGMEYRRAQVRGQRTRWGSYSSTGTLSLNYCLLFVPPELADYLFIHELCHTRHMNHSARYWQLVERFAPDYRLLERRLNEARRDLPRWLRDA
jgi:predicted metal-dependent hydrolase